MAVTVAGYQLDRVVYESERSLVYRTLAQPGAPRVILKILKREYPSPEELARYKQEYELTRSIHSEHVIQTHGFLRYKETYVLLVEDFGGESLDRWLTRGRLSLGEFLPLAIAITQGLADIHAAHIIHKDINPSNLIWNPDTGVLKIIDFGIATRLSRELEHFRSPALLEGTLAYVSPEQTGRMNRDIDYRTDFYSLGVTFHELLTGKRPFEAEDPLSLIHLHLVREPPPLPEREVPPLLRQLVVKLMAKNAEERYQSARGLKADLRRCLEEHEAAQRSGAPAHLAPVALGQEDHPQEFVLPQRLYGRERELARLHQAFAQLMGGADAGGQPPSPSLLLISGNSGVGKTALIQETFKLLTAYRGIFTSGKFDQFQRHTPYSALRQALSGWCRHVLADSAGALTQWKERILQSVRPNARVLTDIFPELERVLGAQPPVPELAPREAENRFQLAFQALLGAIGRRDSPLIIFLDDLQWADTASLLLLGAVLKSATSAYVLVIGAYRDNEVDVSHPLAVLAAELREGTGRIDTLHLENLRLEDLRELLVDTLHSPPEAVMPLATLLYEKTRGNAFHTLELLKLLHHGEFITPGTEPGQAPWRVDLDKLAALPLSGNVVELLIRKLLELPAATRQALKLAACLGNHFELRLLALCHQAPPRQVLAALWPAAAAGLIVPLDRHYRWIATAELDTHPSPESWFRFQHDRVQQACDALMGEDERLRLHLAIGRRMNEQLAPVERQERLLDITDHLDFGRQLLTRPEQRAELCQLNLEAALRAKASNAYVQALSYANIGLELLPPESWRTDYPLTFALSRARHECQYLSGDYEGADETARQLLAHARSALDKAQVYSTMVLQASIRGRYEEALSLGREAARLLGAALPSDEELQARVEQEFATLPAWLDSCTEKELLALPPLSEPESLSLARLLSSMVGAAYFWNLRLWAFLTLRCLHLGLERGLFNELPFALGNTGVICVGRGQYARAYRFTRAAVELAERIGSSVRCRVFNCLALCVSPWAAPLQLAVDAARRGHLRGIEDGDLEHSCYCLFGLLNALLTQGTPLESVRAEADRAIAFAARQKNVMGVPCFTIIRQFALNLQGKTGGPLTFDEGSFREERFHQETRALDMAQCYFHVYKLQSLYLWGHYEEALRMSREAQRTLDQVRPFLQAVEHTFYTALSLTALLRGLPPAEQQRAWEQLRAHQEQLRQWERSCPDNFQHKRQLVDAELARLEGQSLRALRLYHQASSSARQHGFLQDEACAHELAARFCFEQELDEMGEVHIAKAHHLYRLWGAQLKAGELEQRYPHVLLRSHAPAPRGGLPSFTVTREADTPLAMLDALSVNRACQVIGSELVLERLLKKLMHVVLESAGAQRGALLLEQNGELRVATEGSTGQFQVHEGQGLALDSWEGGPRSLPRYVQRTGERLVLGNAPAPPPFDTDAYLSKARPRSVLCMPITRQERLVAILYLENALTSHAFTQERTTLLELLARQMAISLENALLHEREREARTHAEHAVRLRDEFLVVAAHELNTPITSLRLDLHSLRMAARKLALPTSFLHCLDRAERQERRIAKLVKEVMDVANLEVAPLQLTREEVELVQLAREAVEGLDPAAAQARCTFELDAPEPVRGQWDRSRLEQVLRHLLYNALKFGADKPIEVHIRRKGDRAVLRVRDQGIGIDPAYQRLIFEKFGRAVSETNYGGLGLGLYLSRLFIEAHGGTITVQSRAREGAAFTVELPLC